MLKNFSPQGLGITGRQSELIELALTYAFRGMEVNMTDMLKRSQRTSFDDAAKYLRAAEIRIGTFDCGVDLNVSDDEFGTQLAQVHPLTEVAGQLEADLATLRLPPATDQAAFPEFFETVTQRITQVAAVLAEKNIRLAISFTAGQEQLEGKQYPFVHTVESYLALLKNLTADNIGYVIDTWDWHVGGGTMEQIQAIPTEKIFVVRYGALPEDVTAEDAKSTDRILPTTEGPLNHVELTKYLAAAGVEAPVMPTASGAQYKERTREATVNAAQEAIDAIFEGAELPVPPRPMDLVSTMPYEPTPMN
ncbi:TIM barrel protein [Roseimaritima sediminicola]|uniref:TIM barrel protein n=1 Tax=Roseimaritima sediminicola TaxID=2662066 RepID=UPI0012984832|nr:TIM barrel protein [Roseimaritima sediminicola]